MTKKEKKLPSFLKNITITVMDYLPYSQIADRILSQAVCPRCGTPLGDAEYDILSANENQLIMEMDCEMCHSILTAKGDFQKKKEQKMPQLRNRQSKFIVSPETVRGVGSALRGFAGNDIQELLRK